jgi:hypothetical protein
VTGTSDARQHPFRLYRSGTALPEDLADAQRAYDEATIAEGVQAVVDATGPLTPHQHHPLAVLLAPPTTSPTRRPGRTPRRVPLIDLWTAQ